ncbi:MAG: hypothetical protein WB562_12010 [Candidatus Sulfotelmatobacter sp.]
MGLVEFLKSVGGVAVPDEVIEQARQNVEEEKKSRDRADKETSEKKEE